MHSEPYREIPSPRVANTQRKGTQFREMAPLTWVLAYCFLGALMTTSGAAGLTITDQGKSKYRIVVPASAIPSERYAAKELQRYIEKMNGAKLPIVTDAEP